MQKLRWSAAALVSIGALAVSAVSARQAAPAFTLDQVMSYPFPENLVAAPSGARVAWTFNEHGARNIYVADAPDFAARKVTPYDQDDGQELTSVTFSDDGKTIVYVRGGDHGSNWPAEGNLQPDPTSSPVQPKVQIWAVAAEGGGAPTLVADGDDPATAPKTHRVAFVKNRQILDRAARRVEARRAGVRARLVRVARLVA